jgi:hypothetical protein
MAGGSSGCLGSRRWPSTTAAARSISLRLSMRDRSRSISNAASSSMEWRSINMPLARSVRTPERPLEIMEFSEPAQDDIDRVLPVLDVVV